MLWQEHKFDVLSEHYFEMSEMCAFHFKMHKTADCHSNMLGIDDWRLSRQTCEMRELHTEIRAFQKPLSGGNSLFEYLIKLNFYLTIVWLGFCACMLSQVLYSSIGFIGADCSVPENEPPSLRQIENNGTCDVRTQACAKIHLTVNNIVDSENLTCRLISVQVCEV